MCQLADKVRLQLLTWLACNLSKFRHLLTQEEQYELCHHIGKRALKSIEDSQLKDACLMFCNFFKDNDELILRLIPRESSFVLA